MYSHGCPQDLQDKASKQTRAGLDVPERSSRPSKRMLDFYALQMPVAFARPQEQWHASLQLLFCSAIARPSGVRPSACSSSQKLFVGHATTGELRKSLQEAVACVVGIVKPQTRLGPRRQASHSNRVSPDAIRSYNRVSVALHPEAAADLS